MRRQLKLSGLNVHVLSLFTCILKPKLGDDEGLGQKKLEMDSKFVFANYLLIRLSSKKRRNCSQLDPNDWIDSNNQSGSAGELEDKLSGKLSYGSHAFLAYVNTSFLYKKLHLKEIIRQNVRSFPLFKRLCRTDNVVPTPTTPSLMLTVHCHNVDSIPTIDLTALILGTVFTIVHFIAWLGHKNNCRTRIRDWTRNRWRSVQSNPTTLLRY